MQPSDIFAPDSAYSPDPEKLNGNGANQENAESIDIEYPLESMSYEYMIWADNDESEENISFSSKADQSTSVSSRPNNLVSKNNRKSNRNRNIDFNTFDKDGSTKDLNAHNADILIKYMTILLKDAEQKQRAIKRLQAEFEKKSKEVANLKDIYEKLKRKR